MMSGNIMTKVQALEAQRKTCKTDEELLPVMLQIAWEIRRADTDYALKTAQECLAMAERMSNQKQIMDSNNVIGVVYLMKGNYDKAIEHTKYALASSEDAKSEIDIAVFNMNLGCMYNESGDLNTAVECHYKALHHFLRLPTDSWVTNMIGSCYNNLMLGNMMPGGYEKALAYAQKSYDIAIETDDALLKAEVLLNMGKIYSQTGHPEKAISTWQDALEVAEQEGDKISTYAVCTKLSEIYTKQAHLEAAFNILMKRLAVAKQLQQRTKLGETYGAIGVLLSRDDAYQADWADRNIPYNSLEDFFEEIVQFCEADKQNNPVADICAALGNFYAKKQQWELAYEYQCAHSEALQLLHERRVEKIKVQHSSSQQLREKEVELVQQKKLLEVEKKANERLLTLNDKVREQNDLVTEKANKLQSIVKEMENFAFITSHDLKEPLRSISSFLSLLKYRYENQLDEQANEYIDFAMNGAKRLTRLIEDLLIFSRLGNGQIQLERHDLQKIIKASWHSLQAEVQQSQAQLICPASLPELEMQPVLMQQLLTNLLANALKFRGQNAPVITINCVEKKEEDGTETCLLSVADNGIGIAAEYQNKVFQMFKRLHSIEQYEGTGIGLAICKKVVNLHGGKVWLESEVGKGTTFFIRLPKKAAKPISQTLAHA